MMTLAEGRAEDFAEELRAIAHRMKTAMTPVPADGVPGPLDWASSAYRLRRMRDATFDAGLFGDPAWDILLDLYRTHLEGKRIGVSSACIASCVPPTTALRQIDILVQHGLAAKTKCAEDGRKTYLDITEEAVTRMERIFRKVVRTPYGVI